MHFNNCCIYLVLLVISKAAATSQIIYALVLFRHGDRTPGDTVPSLAYNEPHWPNGYEQLTKRGMQQCYQLGEFLRNRYGALLSPTYKKNEVYLQSSDIDRAIQSALSVSAGLYPVKFLEHNWNTRIPWQPIPVHTRPDTEDPWLKPSRFKCPNLKTWRNSHNNPVWDRLLQQNPKYQNLVAYMRNVTGWKDMGLKDVRDVATPLIARKLNGIDWPDWMNETLWDDIEKLRNLHYELKYDEPVEKKLAGGILIGDTLEHLWKKVKNESQEKLRLYSAHAGTVIPFLQNLDVYNGVFPPYAAAVMVELWRITPEKEPSERSVSNDDGSGLNSLLGSHFNSDKLSNKAQYLISVWYRNDTDSLETPSNIAHQLGIPGCPSLNCTIENFEKSLNGRYYTEIKDLKQDCGIVEACKPESSSSSEEEQCSSEMDFLYRIG